MTEVSILAAERASKLTVRPLAGTDVAAVHAIDQASYVDPWPEQQIAVEVDRPDRCHVVAVRGDVILGHASLLIVEPEATLTTIAVAADQRGTGVATNLLLDVIGRAVERNVTDITLEVRTQNRGAHALYRKFGFAPAGVRRKYYPAVGSTPVDDALIMWANDVHTPDYQQRLAAIARHLASTTEPSDHRASDDCELHHD